MKEDSLSLKNKIVILTALSFFLILFLFGWHQGPGTFIWGLYTDIDGQFAEWYTKALSQWSLPFDISNINPYEGMVSLFFPNNVWLNPGALALSLPISRTWTYLLSYGIYLVEISISIYLLARAFKLSRILSCVAAETFALFLFPPFTTYTHAMSFFSAAPFNAHLMALLNFVLILFIQLGKGTITSNLIRVASILLLLFGAFYSGAFTLLTFLPFYAIFSFGILIQDLSGSNQKAKMFIWKLSPLVLFLIIGLMLDSYSYFSSTAQYVSRSLTPYGSYVKLSLSEYLNVLIQAFKKYKAYDRPQVSLFAFRQDYPISWFHALAALGGLVGCFVRRYRWISMSFLCIALLPDILLILIDTQLVPKLALIAPSFFLWSAYSFYALFSVILLDVSWKIIKGIFRESPSLTTFLPNTLKKMVLVLKNLILDGSWLVYIPPLAGLCILIGLKLYLPRPLPPTEKSPIIDHLVSTIKLEPQSTFKGYTISYLGAKGGGIRPHLEVTENQFDYTLYTKSRDYLKKHYNNWYMLSDLWNDGIPSLEEYGQWITKPFFIFVKEMFGQTGAWYYESNINLFSLNYPVLRALGVRFIITDSVLSDPSVRQTTKIEKEGAVPLYLYEILNPNLGHYSPTQVVTLNSAQEIFKLFRESSFNFEDSVVVQSNDVPVSLGKAQSAKVIFDTNKVKIEAKGNGTTLIVLPVQFSHCYQIKDHNDKSDIKVIRANIVQTAIVFKDNLNTELSFNFGMLRNSECRKKDIEDITVLGLNTLN